MTVQSPNRLPICLAAVGLVLLVGAFIHQMNAVPKEWAEQLSKTVSNVAGAKTDQHHGGTSKSHSSVAEAKSWPTATSKPSFYDIALKHGTDKVTDHNYHHMYQKYLEPYRSKPLKFLEIGLGCGMSYGPGASYYTWLEYLPNVNLYYIEYEAACVGKWASETKGATIFAGDQGNVTFLNEFLSEVGVDFDVIVDDGGHQVEQQKTSLEVLWKGVKKGGIYFCEDLQTSYWAHYGGDVGNTGTKKTMMSMIKELADDLNAPTGGHARKHSSISNDMLSVDCMEEVCAFTKKK